jgi:hypothetical protein
MPLRHQARLRTRRLPLETAALLQVRVGDTTGYIALRGKLRYIHIYIDIYIALRGKLIDP